LLAFAEAVPPADAPSPALEPMGAPLPRSPLEEPSEPLDDPLLALAPLDEPALLPPLVPLDVPLEDPDPLEDPVTGTAYVKSMGSVVTLPALSLTVTTAQYGPSLVMAVLSNEVV